jgi:adenylate kinase
VKAIVLFGPPGSGKGTQAKLLRECLDVPHVSTGDMLRERVRQGVENGARMAAKMHAGALVSDQIVNRLVEERLSQPDTAPGFILDGYPRTIQQAEHLRRWFDAGGIREVVVSLLVDYNEIITRLTGRRQCPACGTLYNLVSKPPKQDALCDLDGHGLVIRDDDREEVIRERLENYERQTRPVLEYFQSAGRRVRQIDAGNQSPEQIAEQICTVLDEGFKENGSLLEGRGKSAEKQ